MGVQISNVLKRNGRSKNKSAINKELKKKLSIVFQVQPKHRLQSNVKSTVETPGN